MTPEQTELQLLLGWAKQSLMVVGGFAIMAAGAAFAWGGMALLYGAAIIDWMDPETSWITVVLFFALIGLAGGVAIALLLKLMIRRLHRSSQAQIIMAYSGGMTLIGIGLILGIVVGFIGLVVLTFGPPLAIARSKGRIAAVAPYISDLVAGLIVFPLGLLVILVFPLSGIAIIYTTDIEAIPHPIEQPAEFVDDDPGFYGPTIHDMFGLESDRELDEALTAAFIYYGAINGALLFFALRCFDRSRSKRGKHRDTGTD